MPRPSRISQLLFLTVFMVLFVMTEYRGHDQINAAVNSFFRSNPLVLAGYLLSVKSWSWLLLPALLMTVATLLLGRFFCGWICPLGTILDLFRFKKKPDKVFKLPRGGLRLWLLAALLSASLFNVNLVGLFDPLAILLRGLTFFFYPLLGLSFGEGWVGLYHLIGEKRDSLAPFYAVLRDHLLPFRSTIYPLAVFSALVLSGIVFLERSEARAWCRHLCPLGTLLGWLGRLSPFRRVPAGLCNDCGQCRELCPAAFERELAADGECFRCMSCEKGCPGTRVSFRLDFQLKNAGPLLPQRRALLGGMATGLLLAVPVRSRSRQRESLLRPPGVRDENEFLEKCVRCGECMKVCLKNALYPATWQSGIEGFYTPVVIPRLGYCEYNCTLCGQVCPTAAIPDLTVENKRLEVLGKAVFDKNHCLPFAKRIDCIVCEEHCPIPDKAIRSREVKVLGPDGVWLLVKEPYVVEEICNGCGICENVCPLETKAAIQVFAVRNRTPIVKTDLQKVLPDKSPYSGYDIR